MLLCVLFVTAPAMAQSPRAEVFKDDLLDNLVGEWKLVRKMQSRITGLKRLLLMLDSSDS